MPQNSLSVPGLSREHDEWRKALISGDAALLAQLAANDDPAAALLEIETYINGIYRVSQHPLSKPLPEIQSDVRRVLPYLDGIRARLGWCIRDFDLARLRLIRRSSSLSPVLGAGVSMGAGAPSWPALVRLMLEETLAKGTELYEDVPAADNPAEPPIQVLPDGRVIISGTGTWRVERCVREVKRYAAAQEAAAREVLSEVTAKGASTDVEVLMRGAQICYDLCGQELFRLLTKFLYAHAKGPSETHRAIADLAGAQEVRDRGPGVFPGWDSIITYNIDALMSEALAERKIPHAAWGMKGDQLRGDPDALAQTSKWHQPVYHLHGYTPRRPFLITDIRFVFSTSQYLTVYKGPRSAILTRVFERYLANPVHIALYVGCSFVDAAMNDLLKQAHAKYPGRYHYALLRWPHARNGKEPTPEEMQAEAARYLAFGVRPLWFDAFDEIPGLIRQLQ